MLHFKTLWLVLSGMLLSTGVMAQQTSLDSPLTFNEAVRIALENNVTLKNQKNQLKAERAQGLNTGSQYLPSISILGRGSRTDGQQIDPVTGQGQNVTSDFFLAGIGASYDLFNGLGRLYTYKSAKTDVKAQIHLVNKTQQDVMADVANQYLQILLDKELVKIAHKNLETQKVILKQIEAFVESGARSIPEASAQRAIVKNNEFLLLQIENTLVNDKALLSQLLQLEPTNDFDVAIPDWELNQMINLNYELEELYEKALKNRLDLKQQQLLVESSKYLMKASTGGYFPSVELFANYGSQYFAQKDDPEATDFSTQFFDLNPSLQYGFSFNIPLFDRFRAHSQRVQAKVNYLNSQNQLEDLRKTILIEVQSTYQNFQNAILNYKAAEAQLEAAEISFNLERQRYELGVSNIVAFDQSNQLYVRSQADLVSAKMTLMFQQFLLDYATGTLSFEGLK